MGLTLILGPMKSSKSLDLISYFSPLKYSNVSYALFQPLRDERTEQIWSRNGINIESKKVTSLTGALEKGYEVIGVDEVHMFPEEEADIIAQLLLKGVKVIISGLNLDYRGQMFPIVRRLMELGPTEVRYKKAVCENCKKPEAVFSQLTKDSLPITGGVPQVVLDDGTYVFKPVCRHCFIKA